MMRNVRPITLIGLGVSILALMAITISPPVAIGLGVCGIMISAYALITLKDDDE